MINDKEIDQLKQSIEWDGQSIIVFARNYLTRLLELIIEQRKEIAILRIKIEKQNEDT